MTFSITIGLAATLKISKSFPNPEYLYIPSTAAMWDLVWAEKQVFC